MTIETRLAYLEALMGVNATTTSGASTPYLADMLLDEHLMVCAKARWVRTTDMAGSATANKGYRFALNRIVKHHAMGLKGQMQRQFDLFIEDKSDERPYCNNSYVNLHRQDIVAELEHRQRLVSDGTDTTLNQGAVDGLTKFLAKLN